MAYIVPVEIPECCNKCPFGMLHHSLPFTKYGISVAPCFDGRPALGGEHGYVCNLDFAENGKYTKIMRAPISEDIKRPDWCRLISVREDV